MVHNCQNEQQFFIVKMKLRICVENNTFNNAGGPLLQGMFAWAYTHLVSFMFTVQGTLTQEIRNIIVKIKHSGTGPHNNLHYRGRMKKSERHHTNASKVRVRHLTHHTTHTHT